MTWKEKRITNNRRNLIASCPPRGEAVRRKIRKPAWDCKNGHVNLYLLSQILADLLAIIDHHFSNTYILHNPLYLMVVLPLAPTIPLSLLTPLPLLHKSFTIRFLMRRTIHYTLPTPAIIWPPAVLLMSMLLGVTHFHPLHQLVCPITTDLFCTPWLTRSLYH